MRVEAAGGDRAEGVGGQQSVAQVEGRVDRVASRAHRPYGEVEPFGGDDLRPEHGEEMFEVSRRGITFDAEDVGQGSCLERGALQFPQPGDGI